MDKKFIPWYYQTWLISILFALWVFIIPPIIGLVLLIKQYSLLSKVNGIAAEGLILQDIREEKEAIQGELNSLIHNRDAERDKLNEEAHQQAAELFKELDESKEQLKKITAEIEEKSAELDSLNDEVLYQNFGIYEPKYACMNSEQYKDIINDIQAKQKEMIKDRRALLFFDNWQLDGSVAKGRVLNNRNMQMVLLAFNHECDSIISKVKFNNIEKIEERIDKAAKRINKLNDSNRITITDSYIQLKKDELHAVYEWHKLREDEKEEMRRAREAEKEAKKLAEEIAAERKKITKERSHYENAMEALKEQLLSAKDDEISALKAKLEELQGHIETLDSNMKDIDYREANERAGYVYIISNIGSFGEDVYKIGMTRRLDPQERVNELGDASVPFKFDVHAMIFSDDAPRLESALHNKFDSRKVNMINGRKEFFHVSLEEIESVVKKNYNKAVDFIPLPEAEQYRESLLIRKSQNN